jgi:uncharacterized membrane protein
MRFHRSTTRLFVMIIAGLIAAALTAIFADWRFAAVIGWAGASVTYVTLVWLTIGRMDAATTASHATREDPTRGTSDLLVLLASLTSLGAVVYLQVEAHASSSSGSKVFLVVLAVVSVALSWGLIHTLFTLRYASMYYTGEDGGVDFNQREPPRYTDFAYLSFTIGMTFQVSDTDLKLHAIRVTALRHGLLSYLFGTVILASLVNLIAGLSG